jgi:bifunctional N-acetylglucosamine-1-phosphate-uridyltransferase/glucosamine-1-phosphate-acetyltransferase GlmU-like protein
MEKQLIIIIMAGGSGTRMDSHKDSHAVIEEVGDVPIVVRIINEAARLLPRKLFVVVNENELKVRECVRKYAAIDDVEFINQGPSLGTGHAINMCRSKLRRYNNAQTLIIPGNMALITTQIMTDIVSQPGDIKIPYIITGTPLDQDRIKIVKNKFSKVITRGECCAKDLVLDSVCTGIICSDNMMLVSNIQFIQECYNSIEDHVVEVVNIIKKRETADIVLIKIPIIEHIKVKCIRTQEELIDINNYVDALSLI